MLVVEYKPSLAILTQRAAELGHTGVNPESLAAIKNDAAQMGWKPEVRKAYTAVMEGFRALLAPV